MSSDAGPCGLMEIGDSRKCMQLCDECETSSSNVRVCVIFISIDTQIQINSLYKFTPVRIRIICCPAYA